MPAIASSSPASGTWATTAPASWVSSRRVGPSRASSSYRPGSPTPRSSTATSTTTATRATTVRPASKRHSFRLPTQVSFNPRISKRIPIGPVALEFIAEAFNLFNRTNLIGVQQNYYNFAGGTLTRVATFGTPCAGSLPCTAVSASSGPRIYQLAAKITF